MNGPAHYREGERLLRVASAGGVPGDEPETLNCLLAAHVHMTAALTAATVGSGGQAERSDWHRVLTEGGADDAAAT